MLPEAKLTFECSNEDYVCFLENYSKKFNIKDLFYNFNISLFAALTLGALTLYIEGSNLLSQPTVYIFWGVITLALLSISPYLSKRTDRKILFPDPKLDLKNRFELKIFNHGLEVTNDESKSFSVPYAQISEVEVTPTRINIYYKVGMGIPIPRHKVLSGNLDHFTSQLMSKLDSKAA